MIFFVELDYSGDSLKVKVNSNPDKENDGLLLSTQFNAFGQQKLVKEVNFEVKPEASEKYTSVRRYLLLKNRERNIYSQVILDFRINKEEAILGIIKCTNPFGEKDFEDFTKIAYTGKMYQFLISEGLSFFVDKATLAKRLHNAKEYSQFTVPKGIDKELEMRVDEMTDFLSFSVGP